MEINMLNFSFKMDNDYVIISQNIYDEITEHINKESMMLSMPDGLMIPIRVSSYLPDNKVVLCGKYYYMSLKNKLEELMGKRQVHPMIYRAKSVETNEWVIGTFQFGTMGDVIVEWVDLPPTWENPCGDTDIVHHRIQHKTLCRGMFYKNQWYFEGDIRHCEVEDDDNYNVILIWLQEWNMFAWLEVGEYWEYLTEGVKTLDTVMYWTYPQTDEKEEYKVIGNIFDNIELINYNI